jgi:hypothetical protein
VELCAGEHGWATLLVGAVSSQDLRAHLESRAPSIVVLAASRASDAPRVDAYVAAVRADCDRLDIPCTFAGDAFGAQVRADGLRGWLQRAAGGPGAGGAPPEPVDS